MVHTAIIAFTLIGILFLFTECGNKDTKKKSVKVEHLKSEQESSIMGTPTTKKKEALEPAVAVIPTVEVVEKSVHNVAPKIIVEVDEPISTTETIALVKQVNAMAQPKVVEVSTITLPTVPKVISVSDTLKNIEVVKPIKEMSMQEFEAQRRIHNKAEADRWAREKAQAEQIAKEKAQAERIAEEKAEAKRVAEERAEAERILAKVKAKIEAQRIAKEKAEILANAEAKRVAKEKEEAQKVALQCC
ncbi:MAG: hypothetical protein KU29_12185 [Sulfurovum sp. FS06-10]|nr:MAG: hypothetical protein KU29_12185 [Sulfurovum sp. FS06-10]